MEVIGLIAEYNPFHYGHLYQIEEIKRRYPDSLLVVVLSGNFTQRGLPGVIDKWNKTEIAINHGVDLVIELPFPFALQSADFFAKGAISILKEIKANRLIFGSESGDASKLFECALVQLENDSYQEKVKDYLDQGYNYPTSMSKALYDLSGIKIIEPNDLLGLSYIKEIKRQHALIKVDTIKRTTSYLSKKIEGVITSSTSIRHALINNEDISEYVPSDVNYALKNSKVFLNDYFPYFRYKVNTERDLSKYLDVDEGIHNRILKYINTCSSMEEFIEKIKTKRYTYNKIQRMIIHILCDFTKDDRDKYTEIPYIRVLGFTDNGRCYLNKIKKELDVPLLTKFIKGNPYLDLELKVTKIYSTVVSDNLRHEIIQREINSHPKN